MLLEKMTQIIANKSVSPSRHNRTQTLPPLHHVRSLNRYQRQKDMDRIMEENARLLKRLQNREANYSVKDWARQDRENSLRVKSICDYPHILRKSANFATSTISKISLNQSLDQRGFTKAQLSTTSLDLKDHDVVKYSGQSQLGTSDQTFKVEMVLKANK